MLDPQCLNTSFPPSQSLPLCVCLCVSLRTDRSDHQHLTLSSSLCFFLSSLSYSLHPLPISQSLPSFPVFLSLTVSLISLPLSISLSFPPFISYAHSSPPLLLLSLSLSSSYSVSLPLIFFQCLSPPLSTSPLNSVYLSPPLPSMSLSSSVSLYFTHSPSPLLSAQSPSPLISVSLFLSSSFSLSLSLRPPSLFSSGESETCGSHPSIIHPSN